MRGGDNIKVKIIQITIFVFFIILEISSYVLIKDFLEYKRANNANLELIENVIIENQDVEKTNVDWEKLKEINEDIIGWINIENTNINYPILKDDNSLKYLNHSYDKKYNRNGSIFTLNDNAFQDNETIIYGHNMKNGIMFSQLSNYLETEFFYKHLVFKIHTKNQDYKAIVFSCYSIGVSEEENNIKLLNFKEKLEYYKKTSVYPVENIGEIKKIVKLSTCSYIDNHTTPTDQRYYIVAKLEEIN